MNIAVVLTCHNRRDKTLQCLQKLSEQELADGINVHVTLMDDGSSDGTSEAVKESYPKVEILHGNGNLYWCGGMREAWKQAAVDDPDFYLLLNDDTMMYPHALGSLLTICGSSNSLVIAIGAVCDPASGQQNYGGACLSTGRVPAMGKVESCDTFNGNCVLLTRAVYQRMGIFHHAYTHAMGDTDYGFQARRNGVEIFQSAGFLAVCPSNPVDGTWRDTTLGRWQRFKALQSPKGLPFFEWLEFNRRNSGFMWPYYVISPFLRILAGK